LLLLLLLLPRGNHHKALYPSYQYGNSRSDGATPKTIPPRECAQPATFRLKWKMEAESAIFHEIVAAIGP
jgi:hypothetical protein